MRHEAAFTTKFRRYAVEHIGTGAYEVKHTRGEDFFLTSELYEHQKDALLAAKSKYGIGFKIPDEGLGYRPFDMFVLKGTGAWVVIAYPKEFVVIDIEKIIKWTAPRLQLRDAKGMAAFIRPLSALQ